MMSLKDQLDNCEYLLADAEMAGDWNAVRRFREYRLRLVRQLCRQRAAGLCAYRPDLRI